MLILAQGSVSMLQKFVVIFEANLRLSPDCGVSRFDILHTLPPLPYTLFEKRALGEQKFTVLAEFSASTAENSASTGDFHAMPSLISTACEVSFGKPFLFTFLFPKFARKASVS